ncbi:MAG: hypothetical protein OXF47_11770 [Nitrospira sp.]|nr:hypothetical protein [Nitrospira sp.]
MPKKPKRFPKGHAYPPHKKEVRANAEELERQESATIAWKFSALDDGGEWGWEGAAKEDWWEKIFTKLKSIDSMTWAELARATGGRNNGNNHHFVQVKDLAKQAKDRLKEKNQEDVTQLFSLRLNARTRIYGIRDGRALKLLWYDPNHTVCPVTKK